MRFLLLSLFIFFNLHSSAQTWIQQVKEQQKAVNTSDPRAKKILDRVSLKYKSYKTIVAAFTLKIENTEKKINEEQNGKVYLSGVKYKLEMQSQDVICDNKNIWTYLKEAKEVQVNYYEPDGQSINPSQLFTIYDKGFLYVSAGVEKGESGIVLDVIDFTPNDKSKPFFKIKLYIDRANSNIKMAKIFEKNGNRYTYSLNSFEANKELGDMFFSWNAKANPGISVIDLR